MKANRGAYTNTIELRSCKKYLPALLLILLLSTSTYFLVMGQITEFKFMPIIFSPVICFIFLWRTSNGTKKIKKLSENIQEAQTLISQKCYALFRNSNRDKVLGNYHSGQVINFDLLDVLSSPLVWLLCLSVGLMLYLNPIYLDIELTNPMHLIKIGLLAFIQLLFFSAFLCGVIIKFKNRGVK